MNPGKKGMTAQLIDSLAENEEIGLNEAIDALELQDPDQREGDLRYNAQNR